jgi:hypothetical protein
MTKSEDKIYIIIILIIILIIISLWSNNENFETVPISNGSDSVNIENEQTNIQTPNTNSLCKVAFDNYDLYPSSNPLVVKGNDINWNYKNNITDYDTLYKIGTSNYTALNNIIPNYNPNDIESTKKAFNTLLEQSPKKIGCCFRQKGDDSKRTVLARTPLNPDDKTITPPFDQYDFKFKSLDIPAGTCPVTYFGGSTDCNAFFDVYCKNVINEFQKKNFKPEDFTKYAPECACYAPKTELQQIYPDNTPPACYKNGCDNIINPTCYIDPISRAQPCDITVCQNIFNAQVGNVGGNVIIDPKLENTCGASAPKDDKNTSQTGTTGGSGGSSSSDTKPTPSSQPTDITKTTSDLLKDGNNTTTIAVIVIVVLVLCSGSYAFINK